MNEAGWQTFKQHIDARLRSIQTPWKIIQHRDGLDLSSLDRHAVEQFPNANGPADCAFFANCGGSAKTKQVSAELHLLVTQLNEGVAA